MTKALIPTVLAAVLYIALFPSIAIRAGEPTLWISDDVNRRVYEVTLEGDFLSDFTTNITTNGSTFFPISPSSVAVDPTDDTLWVVQEKPARLINFDKTGNQLQLISATFADGPEGMAVDYFDGSLWLVDDPDDPTAPDQVYHLERDGSVILSFPTSAYAPGVESQQAVAADPVDGSLWVTDNRFRATGSASVKWQMPYSAAGTGTASGTKQALALPV